MNESRRSPAKSADGKSRRGQFVWLNDTHSFVRVEKYEVLDAHVKGIIREGGWDIPGDVQLGQDPLHASVVSPAMFPYVPIGHGLQSCELAEEYVPGLQRTQLVIPFWIHEPAGQGRGDGEGETDIELDAVGDDVGVGDEDAVCEGDGDGDGVGEGVFDGVGVGGMPKINPTVP